MSVATLRFEPPRLQRGDGALDLGFDHAHGRSALTHLYQRNPCRALFPRVLPEDAGPTAVLLVTSGGLTGGDRLKVGVRVGARAEALVTSQAAEKIYRSLGDDVCIDIALEVGGDGTLEFLPQETILFNEARLVRRTRADLAASARLLAAEMTVFGRIARGEVLKRGLWHEGWEVRVAGKLRWWDAQRLSGDIERGMAAPAGFAAARAVATILYVAEDAATFLPLAREVADGASLVNGVLILRYLGEDAMAVRADLMRALCLLRRAALKRPASLPAVWAM